MLPGLSCQTLGLLWEGLGLLDRRNMYLQSPRSVVGTRVGTLVGILVGTLMGMLVVVLVGAAATVKCHRENRETTNMLSPKLHSPNCFPDFFPKFAFPSWA